MPQFIELIDQNGKDFIVNTSHIVRIFPVPEGAIIHITKDNVSDNKSVGVKNKYSDIKNELLQ